MKKSLYSLTLMDDVVREIDKLAHLRHTNRSNLVNRILAEYISYVTPEQRFQEILACVQEEIHACEELQSQLKPTDKAMVIRSAIRYRYNPVILYSVEMGRQDDGFTIWVKAQARTQNQKLLDHLDAFFGYWSNLERRYHTGCERELTGQGGRFGKRLAVGMQNEPREVGSALGAYIEALDKAIKIYFDRLDRSEDAAEAILTIYQRLL